MLIYMGKQREGLFCTATVYTIRTAVNHNNLWKFSKNEEEVETVFDYIKCKAHPIVFTNDLKNMKFLITK